jgi:hypothetical protein
MDTEHEQGLLTIIDSELATMPPIVPTAMRIPPLAATSFPLAVALFPTIPATV